MHFIYDDFFLKHENGPSHPENPERLIHIINAVNNWEYRDCLEFTSPDEADEGQVGMVHNKEYINTVRNLSEKGGISFLDMDTGVNRYTFRSALLGAGGCFKGLDLIFEKKPRFNKFFLAARPPGHHAFPSRGSGFCIFNNIALGTRYAQKRYGIKKITIIDFDAHHGNGTQDIFYEDKNVLYISFHQYPHYPGTGDVEETGSGNGKGYNINFPFIPGTKESDYIAAFIDPLLSIIENFDPDLFLVSAGYDSHFSDPMSSLGLISGSYRKIMTIISVLAQWVCRGRVGIVLEGGYEYFSTAESVLETLSGCMDVSEYGSVKDRRQLQNHLSREIDDLNKKIRNPHIIERVKKLFGTGD